MESRYRLIRPIASGGMAQVFEAVAIGELGFERSVAVKRILPQYAHSAQLRRMFLDEAHIASHLHHTNIVSVLDYGVVDGDEFLVMEYVDGVDLGRMISAGQDAGRPMQEGLALHIVAEVAQALDYAHRCQGAAGEPLGIVHRDVSPGNILVSWEGQVKLSDFGIALAAVRQARTETGMVKGKQAYMAPEQARGEPVTGAADIYSLGVTLNVAASSKFADVRLAKTGLGRDVADIVEACTRQDPAARITATELATRLGHLVVDRLGRDPTDALRDWFAHVRPKLERRRPIDSMLELVLAPVAGDGGRSYTAHPAASPPAHTELVAAETVAEPPPARGQGRRRRVAGASVFVALTAAAALLLWVRMDTQADPEARADAALPVEAPVAASPAPPVAPPALATDAAPAEPAVEVALRIDSSPTGADVYRQLDGVRIGRTPLSHRLVRGDGELALVLRLDGYRDHVLAIPISTDAEVAVDLHPAPSPSHRSKRARSTLPAPRTGIGDEPVDPFDKLDKGTP